MPETFQSLGGLLHGDLARIGDADVLGGAARLGAEGLHLLDEVHALKDAAEDDVLDRSIQNR